jgi:hypothetical protein
MGIPNLTSHKLKAAIREKFAWPGGYEIFGVTNDGACLCTGCMRKEYKQIAYARLHNLQDGWRVEAISIDCYLEETVFCEHCNKPIGPEFELDRKG